MFYLADGHAEFVGNKQNNAESQNRPADDTAVPQPLCKSKIIEPNGEIYG